MLWKVQVLIAKYAVFPDSCFFSVGNFLQEVSSYTRPIGVTMLSNGEVDFCVVTDTLLCLNDDELNYLPLWAGGNDDGSGGVFSVPLPPAEMGPNGPGPAYHTGYSVMSTASTERDWDGISESSTVDTSVAVENGFSDHIDRHAVKSNESFGGSSIVFTDDTEDYGDKDKVIDFGDSTSEFVDVEMHESQGEESPGEKGDDDDDDDDDMLSWSGSESWVDEDGQL